MTTAVDTNVLLGILLDDPHHAEWSKARREGNLIVCEVACAELAGFSRMSPDLQGLLGRWDLLRPSTPKVLNLARGSVAVLRSEEGQSREVPDLQ